MYKFVEINYFYTNCKNDITQLIVSNCYMSLNWKIIVCLIYCI